MDVSALVELFPPDSQGRHPEVIEIDRVTEGIDDESCYVVSAFEELPEVNGTS